MGDIADAFGGKVNGELIRAADWNGLIGAFEARIDGLEAALATRLTVAEARLSAVEAAIPRLAPLEALAELIRTRYRRLELATARETFAVGERAEVVARLTAFDGSPLTLTDPATRPWIDFVTVWGSLKAAPGFTARAGTGGRTVTVQVNASGEARALLREETAEVLAEEQELEVASVLGTTFGGLRVADAFLAASNPQSTALSPAYEIVTNAYQRTDTPVMRNYLDGIYLRNPQVSFTRIAPVFTVNWRDTYATVLAFAKLDDSPTSADGSVAVGSLRVTFRDWVYPWLFTHFLVPDPPLIGTYVDVFTPLIQLGLEPAYSSMFERVQERVLPLGLLGQQREFIAARAAITALPAAERPSYFGGLVTAMQGGLAAQQGMLYSIAVSPGVAETIAPGAAVGRGAVVGEAAAGAVAETIRAETGRDIAEAQGRIVDLVAAENGRFRSDLLAEGGPVRLAEQAALDAASKVETVSQQLNGKAPFELVSRLLEARNPG